MQHTNLVSPSKYERRAKCAGSHEAEMAVPKEERNKDTPASIQGTVRHLLAEWRFANPSSPDWPETVDDNGTDRAASQDDIVAAEKAFGYVKTHKAYLNRGQTGFLAHAERTVEIGKWVGLEEGSFAGTADAVLVQPGVVEVVDYKFGRWLVSPDSWQFKTLAIGVVAELIDPVTGAFLPEYAQTRVIKLTVVQPEGPEMVRSAEFNLDVLGEWMQTVRDDVARIKPGAPRTPGDWCKFCAAAGTCRERMRSAGVALESMFEEVPETKPPGNGEDKTPAPIATVDSITELAEARMTQDPEELTPEEIGRICDQALLVEGWFKDIRKRRDELLTAGQAVPGWKLVEGRKKREWAQDEAATVTRLKKWLSVADIYPKVLISPAKAEKLEGVQKTKLRQQQFKELIQTTDGKPVAAPESDPRPSVNQPSGMFEPVAEQATTDIPDFL